MANGFELEGTCYTTSSQAVDAYYSQVQPYYLNALGATTLIQFKYYPISGTWYYQRSSINASTGATTLNFSVAAPIPSFRSCTLPNDNAANFIQGQELGWAVASLMVIVAVIRMIYRR